MRFIKLELPFVTVDYSHVQFQEYILEMADREKKAARLMASGSAVTFVTDLADKRESASLKIINSKTQLKSSSKASGKSGGSS